jgi:hypothetical protein
LGHPADGLTVEASPGVVPVEVRGGTPRNAGHAVP